MYFSFAVFPVLSIKVRVRDEDMTLSINLVFSLIPSDSLLITGRPHAIKFSSCSHGRTSRRSCQLWT